MKDRIAQLLGTKRARAFVALLVVAAIVVPSTISSADDFFNDVPDTAPNHDFISALASAGITTGCGSGNYCPASNVTRRQMAVFLSRLGALRFDDTTVTNAFLLNGVLPVNDAATFTLAGGSGVDQECEEVDFAVQFDDDDPGTDPFEMPFGAYTVHVDLFEVPATQTAAVSVQLNDSSAGADEADNVYDVCFSTVDGSDLVGGDYNVYRQTVINFGGNIYGPAGASTSSTTTSGGLWDKQADAFSRAQR